MPRKASVATQDAPVVETPDLNPLQSEAERLLAGEAETDYTLIPTMVACENWRVEMTDVQVINCRGVQYTLCKKA